MASWAPLRVAYLTDHHLFYQSGIGASNSIRWNSATGQIGRDQFGNTYVQVQYNVDGQLKQL